LAVACAVEEILSYLIDKILVACRNWGDEYACNEGIRYRPSEERRQSGLRSESPLEETAAHWWMGGRGRRIPAAACSSAIR
jgi:hypothetical protein